MIRPTICFVLFLAGWGSSSQEAALGGRAEDNPLKLFIGAWEVQEDIAPGPMGPARTGRGEMNAKWGPGGRSVVLEYESVAGPMKGFALTEVIAMEATTNEYSLIWVDSFSPGIKSQSGVLSPDGEFVFISSERRGGTDMKTTNEIRPTDGGFVITSYSAQAGADPQRVMTLTYSPIKQKQ